jgi:hypothetical protein
MFGYEDGAHIFSKIEKKTLASFFLGFFAAAMAMAMFDCATLETWRELRPHFILQ